LYKGEAVPVGEDQVPHVEITREIARKFNKQYGKVFREPKPLLTNFSRLVGLDGNAKMSKSLNNTILLSDEPETVEKKLKKAKTDPQKIRKNDPGHPEVCLVFSYHQKFNPEEIQEIESGCKSGALGCVDCKLKCTKKINKFLAPVIEIRKKYENNIDEVKEILHTGEEKARNVASTTMQEVREAMKLG
jgi:tryptophanyl-tRNA synthetase